MPWERIVRSERLAHEIAGGRSGPALRKVKLDAPGCRGTMLVAPESAARRAGFLIATDGGVLLLLDAYRDVDPGLMEAICTDVLAALRR